MVVNIKFNCNGFIVQNNGTIDYWHKSMKNIDYHGINAFSDYPLFDHRMDSECKVIQDEIWWRNNDDGTSEERCFISDSDLLRRYIAQCKKFNISLRVLFLESEIDDYIWNEPLLEMKFIGYEYCECPFDCQVISDLDMHEYFQKYRDMLNEYGLFSTLEDAQNFKTDYDKAFQEGVIGDGDMDTYIFRVSEVNMDWLMIN